MKRCERVSQTSQSWRPPLSNFIVIFFHAPSNAAIIRFIKHAVLRIFAKSLYRYQKVIFFILLLESALVRTKYGRRVLSMPVINCKVAN
jgi:hypothetical protein